MIELGGERQGSRDAYKVVCEQMVAVEEQVARASRQNVFIVTWGASPRVTWPINSR